MLSPEVRPCYKPCRVSFSPPLHSCFLELPCFKEPVSASHEGEFLPSNPWRVVQTKAQYLGSLVKFTLFRGTPLLLRVSYSLNCFTR